MRAFLICFALIQVGPFLSGVAFGQEQESSCVTAGDTAESIRALYSQIVMKTDSATLAALNLPYRPPAGVTVVTDNSICTVAASAYNRAYPLDSLRSVTRVVVVQVGSDRYVVWSRPTGTSSNARSYYFVFDDSFNFLKLLM